MIYNIENNNAVKMEVYGDGHATNEWEKVSELVDDSGWYADAKKFGKVDCNRPRDQVLTEAGSVVASRSDDVFWDFKNLSLREIELPVQDSSVLQFTIFPR